MCEQNSKQIVRAHYFSAGQILFWSSFDTDATLFKLCVSSWESEGSCGTVQGELTHSAERACTLWFIGAITTVIVLMGVPGVTL